MARPWFIYILIDPRDGEVRYVGWTTRPRSRLGVHLCNARRGESYYVSRWIASLLAEGLQPAMRVIEAGDGCGYAQAERGWIAHYRVQGCRLTNLTDGGDGAVGLRHSTEAKAKMSAAKKGRPVGEAALRNLAKSWQTPLSRESRAKIGLAHRGKIVGAEARAKLRAANLGKHHSEETCAKISEIGRGRKRSLDAIERTAATHRGRKRSPEVCARISAAKKGICLGPRPPDVKEKISRTLHGRVFSQDHLQHMAEAQRRRWKRVKLEAAA